MMAATVLFSVCIPYYGKYEYLREAIISIADQTFRDYEMVVSLDATLSDDERFELETLGPIRWLENPSPGMVSNWNHCVLNAHGRFVVLLHSDDRLKPNYLSKMAELFASEPEVAACFCGVQIIDDTGNPQAFSLADSVKRYLAPSPNTYTLAGDAGLRSILRGCYIFCPTVCYQKVVLEDCLFDARWAMVPDLDLYARFLMSGYAMLGTRDCLFEYRRHQANATAKLTKSTVRFLEEWALYNELAERCAAIGWRGAARQAKLKTMLRMHVLYQVVIALRNFDIARIGKLLSLLMAK